MAGSTGRDGQVGFGEETTYGTAVTPTRFYGFTSEGITFERERIDSQNLLAGQRRPSEWVKGREGGSGPITFEIIPQGAALIFEHMLGKVTTTTPDGATNARLHTIEEGTLDDKSLTVQIGRPNNTGTVDPYTYGGGKVASWEISMEESGILMGTPTFDVRSESTETALATASYPSTRELLSWADASNTVTVNSVAYKARQITVGDDNGLKSDRYAIGSPNKLEQVEGTQFRQGTGTIELESYPGLTPYELFQDGTEVEIECLFVGGEIEVGFNYQIKVTMPRCRIEGTTPNVEGPDMLGYSIPFVVLDPTDSASGIKVEIQNKDTTP